MFLNFSTQWNSMGRGNRRWKAALEVGAWISLHFRSSRFQNQTRQLTQTNTTHEGFWFSIIPQELQTRSDLSSARSQKDNNFTRKTLRELHQTIPFALRAETSPRSSMIPLETKFNTQTTVISHRRRKRFSSSAGHLFRSEFSDYQQNTGFGDKSIVSLHFPRKFRADQLGLLLSINFDLRNVIFQPMLFPFVWGKYKWKFMSDRYKLSFHRPLAASQLARPLSRSSLRSPK